MEKSSQSEMQKVLFADNFFMSDKALNYISKVGEITWANCKTKEEMIRKIEEIKPKVIVSEYFKIDGHLMEISANLKGIGVWGVGYDHIDVEAASERGIYVVNTRGSNAESVAEHVLAFMLELSRKLHQNDTFVRNGGWISREESGLPLQLMAEDLLEKTLGIIGLGAIGSRVARIAHGFKMHVLASDPYVTEKTAEEKGVELVTLEDLLKKSDFVTIHVILNETTKGLIGATELKMMKPTAYLINASRGQVVSEKELIKALRKNYIAGAGLDVFSKEPIDPKNPLLNLNNLVITPHCAGNSKDALNATSLMISHEVVQILLDKIPENLVNQSQLRLKGFTV